MVSPGEDVKVTASQQKSPPNCRAGRDYYPSILHPKRLDILRERVVIGGAIAVAMEREMHETNVSGRVGPSRSAGDQRVESGVNTKRHPQWIAGQLRRRDPAR